MSDPSQALSWVYTMLETPKKERLAWVKRILSGMLRNAASFVRKDSSKRDFAKEQKRVEKELEAIISLLKEDCEIVGLTPNIQYLRVEGSEDLLKPWWVHPFSSPTILAKHKTLPIMFIVGASIQKDKASIYTVEKDNIVQESIIGITG